MKEYDLNLFATQMISVKAETEEEAVEKARWEAFEAANKSPFADFSYEVVDVKEL